MSKELTEKWKNGELDDGWYYLKVKSELANCPVISECVTNYSQLEPYSDFYEYDDSHIKEVLAPVPSYDEHKELVSKADKLEKQLAIAIKALKEYDNKLNWDIRGVAFMKYNKGFTIARKALKEMEEV